MKPEIEKLCEYISKANNIVFLGGAGTSTESGIPDFRGGEGLKVEYDPNKDPEILLSHKFYAEHPEEFFEYYREKMIYLDAKPNPCHTKLAELEACGKLTAIITQNVDGLHQMAGSKKVLELHGSVHRNYCKKCGKAFDAAYIKNSSGIPVCDKCGGDIKPDVVLYGESVDMYTFDEATKLVKEADMFIIGGTSSVVYPAAFLMDDFWYEKYPMVFINRRQIKSPNALCIQGNIGEIFDQVKW